MPDYDFSQLSHYEFEGLARDLLQKEWGVTLETFSRGRDQGIDLRYSSCGDTTIIQCKHYFASGYSTLKSHLKNKELDKVKKLNPARYVLVTSVQMSPGNKLKIFEIFQPYIKVISDIICLSDINNLLTLHPSIEKSTFKLWISSVAVFERIIYNAEVCQTEFRVGKIIKKARLYVQNSAFEEAQNLLYSRQAVLISGPPGIGKTTLAEMLLLDLLEKGYEPVEISQDVIEAKKLFKKSKKQVFYFDDFLGRTFFRDGRGYFMKNDDKALLDFIEMVLDTDHSKFILTTREHILKNAFISSEAISANHVMADRILLNISNYTKSERAKILYNHLYFSDLPYEFKGNILKDDFFMSIINHRNFNPRLIEWLSNYKNLRDVTASGYNERFSYLLDNPESVWQHAFRDQISESARSILLALLACGGSQEIVSFEKYWQDFHDYRSNKYNFSRRPGDFKIGIRELEGSFINIYQYSIAFTNPSVVDFLQLEAIDCAEHLEDIIQTADNFRKIMQIWTLSTSPRGAPIHTLFSEKSDLIASKVSRLLDTLFQIVVVENGRKVLRQVDINFEDRALLLARIAEIIGGQIYNSLAQRACGLLIENWKVKEPNYSDALDFFEEFDVLASKFGDKNRLLMETMRSTFVRNLRDATISDFARISESIQNCSVGWEEENFPYIRQAVVGYVSSGLNYEKEGIGSASELSDLRENLVLLGREWNLAVWEKVEELDSEIASREHAESLERSSQSEGWTGRIMADRADEAEIRAMFDTLI